MNAGLIIAARWKVVFVQKDLAITAAHGERDALGNLCVFAGMTDEDTPAESNVPD